MRPYVITLLENMEADFASDDAAARVARHYSDDAVLRDMTVDEPLVGKQAIYDALVPLFEALSEFGYSTTVVSDDGRTAVVEWVTTGRHTGSFGGEAPTGQLVSYRGVNLLTFGPGELITEEVCYWDSAQLSRVIASVD